MAVQRARPRRPRRTPLTAVETLNLHESEADLQAKILQLAGYQGWLAYHTHDSRRSQEGFPDLVLVRAPRLIFAELKSMRGSMSPAQYVWLDELDRTPAEVYIWRPCDWPEIERILLKE